MSSQEGFNCYKLYLALQRHFSSSYDFFKYNGKTKADIRSYNNRNDMYSFEKCARIIKQEDMLDFFICHFIDDKSAWIKNMSKDNLFLYRERLVKLPKVFSDDIELLFQYEPNAWFETSGSIPLIHKLAIERKISTETIIILDMIYPFLDRHKKEVKVLFVFDDYIHRIIKYKPFLIKKISGMDTYIDIFKKHMKQKEH